MLVAREGSTRGAGVRRSGAGLSVPVVEVIVVVKIAAWCRMRRSLGERFRPLGGL